MGIPSRSHAACSAGGRAFRRSGSSFQKAVCPGAGGHLFGAACCPCVCAVSAAGPSDDAVCVQKQQDATDYANLLATRKAEERERRSESLARKRAARIASQASKEA